MSRLQIILVTFLILFYGCNDEQKNSDDNTIINAATTLVTYADFINQIGGKYVSVHSIVPVGANAHNFEPAPQELVNISNADLYFAVGAGFEFEKELLSNKTKIVDCSKDIEIISNDPHLWLSPKNVKVILGTIYEKLKEFRPDNADYFKSNFVSYISNLDSTFEDIQTDLENIQSRNIFVYHNAWNYLARDLNLIVYDIEHGGKKPKLKDLDKHIKSAKIANAKVIFADPNLSSKSAEIIANELKVNIEFLNPLPENYLSNLTDIGKKLKRALND